jgi:cytoskeletal protein CcmA (bactofilin family)
MGRSTCPGGPALFNATQRPARDATVILPPTTREVAPARHSPSTVIGSDVTITGNIHAATGLLVDGRIEGDIDCGSFEQGPESTLRGSLKAQAARVAGRIEGSVIVRQLIVQHTAHILGDVDYDAITIETGAHLEGRLRRVPGDAAVATDPMVTAFADSTVY